MAERMVQFFKRSLEALASTHASIYQRLADFLSRYRTTHHDTTGRSPASLFLGRQCPTHLSLLHPDVELSVGSKQAEQVALRQSTFREFYVGEHVVLRDVRSGSWLAGTVAERSGPKSYVVILEDGRIWKCHVNHVRRSDSPVSKEAHELSRRERGELVQLERSSPEPIFRQETADVPVPADTAPRPQSDNSVPVVVSPTEPLEARRSLRAAKKPERLIEQL